MLIGLELDTTLLLESGLICMVLKSPLSLAGMGFDANWHRVRKTNRLTMRTTKWTGRKPKFILIAGKKP